MFSGLARPRSRGRLRLSGPDLNDPILIEPNSSSSPKTWLPPWPRSSCAVSSETARVFPRWWHEKQPQVRAIDQARSILSGAQPSPTGARPRPPKRGRDNMSVVDNELKVYVVEGLRVADPSIMPRITTGNTMAPCVVIGERAADLIGKSHGLSSRFEPVAHSV
ncbi:GMC oxidoreductase [Rhizobium sp. LjRoot98]|uniref:GMC oxidoreductase n=1 Tax=Rhizobium sp. LjRoot98 TaxID=3342345 RepID=UPI003ECC985F